MNIKARITFQIQIKFLFSKPVTNSAMRIRSLKALSLFSLVLFALLPYCGKSQTDTEFWFAAPEVSSAFNYDRPIFLRITAYSNPANVIISQPANPSFPVQTIAIPANLTQSLDLSAWIDLIECKPGNIIQNKGIKITSDNKIAVYYEVDANGPNPELFALKGRNALGNEFLVSSQYLLNNTATHNPTPYSSFNIVATEDNTQVTIVPTANIVGRPANIPFSIILNKGQTFAGIATSTLANQHLQGSSVTSTKPVAITLSDDLLQGIPYGGLCEDLAGDQTVPVGILGTEYIAFKSNLSSPYDKLYITATQNGTIISQDGVAGPAINAGQSIELSIINPTTYIQSTSSIYVYQMGGVSCEVGSAILPKIVCTGSNSVSVTRSTVESFIITLLVKNGGQNSFLVNNNPGVVTAAQFSLVPGTPDWYGAKVNLPLSGFPNGSVIRVQNTARVFQMGVMQGGPASGAAFGYFSDFNSFRARANAADSSVCVGESINLFADSILTANYNWTGPLGFSSTSPNISIPNVNLDHSGYYHLEMTIPGCGTYLDSVLISINQPVSNTLDVSICEGQSYLGFSSTGTYINTFTGSNGCDSTRILNLTIKPKSSSIVNAVICQGNSLYGYSTTGTYSDVFTGANGCDSTRVLNLVVNPATSTSLSAAICEGQSHLGYSVSGIYNDTLTAANGCDSIRILNLTVNPKTYSTINHSICEGESYLGYNQAGSYLDTLTNINGCDSIRTLNLIVNQKTTSSVNIEICEGGNYNGYTIPGIYIDTLSGTNGCDSIRTLTLSNLPRQYSNMSAAICEGSSFLGYTSSGFYTDTLVAANGCDSIRNINLVVKSRTYSELKEAICRGQSYYGYTETGIYKDTLTGFNGCDSIRTIRLLVHEPITAYLGPDKLICTGDSIVLDPGNFPGSIYAWNNGSISNTITVRNEGNYSVTVSNICGDSNDDIFVKVSDCELHIPNTFTPNNDGKNETFKIIHSHPLAGFQLLIFNRWGEKVFETLDSQIGWNGIFKGKIADAGAYVWHCKYTKRGLPQYIKGTVLLLR